VSYLTSNWAVLANILKKEVTLIKNRLWEISITNTFLTECLGFVESSKAATDIISPVTGEITEVNEKVLQNPAGLAYGSKGG
jgi:glycine cleavage system H lipoate-binding protein